MKIFLSCDIEGTNGICDWDETESKTEYYRYFADRMNMEAASVCNGINKLDPQADIFVKDAHDSGRNLLHDKLPENVTLNRGWAGSPYSMMYGIDESFDAAIFTGYHNASGTNSNPLAHTMTAALIYVKINGMIASEFLINYYSALYNKVPVVMVSGDEGLCKAVKEIDSNIYTVVTSVGVGNSVTSKHPERTYKELAETAAEAVGHRDKMRIELPERFKIEIYHKNHAAANRHSYYPGAYATGSHTVGFECTDYFEFLKFLMFR